MSRRYSAARPWVVLVAAIVVAAVFTGSAFAQGAGGDAAAPVVKDPLKPFIMAFDWIVIGTILILSIFGLTLIIQGFIRNRESVFMPETSTQMIRDMIQTKRFKDLIEFTETDPSFVSRALNPALKRAPSFSSMKEAMETSIGEQSAEQFRKIEYLNIIGNLGPLLGLLGTVLGMIMAFREMMNQGGKASPADLAGGISTALFHTFAGLALAVPCLACFGILRTLVDRLTVRGALVAEEMLLMVKPQETKSAAAPAAAAPGAPGARPAPAMPAPMPAMPRKVPAPPPAPSV
jgi:biopolymer transport protein ExbB